MWLPGGPEMSGHTNECDDGITVVASVSGSFQDLCFSERIVLILAYTTADFFLYLQ